MYSFEGAYMSIVVQGVKRDVYPGVWTSYVVYVLEYYTLFYLWYRSRVPQRVFGPTVN